METDSKCSCIENDQTLGSNVWDSTLPFNREFNENHTVTNKYNEPLTELDVNNQKETTTTKNKKMDDTSTDGDYLEEQYEQSQQNETVTEKSELIKEDDKVLVKQQMLMEMSEMAGDNLHDSNEAAQKALHHAEEIIKENQQETYQTGTEFPKKDACFLFLIYSVMIRKVN